ncbi:DUF5983 family protein [Metabacillus sp. SLBN-84]
MSEFHQTYMGKAFYEHHVPKIAQSLEIMAREQQKANELKERELGMGAGAAAREIQSMMTLSTAHVKAETADLLQEASHNGLFVENISVYEKGEFGYFIYLDPETIAHSLPEDLKQVLEHARRHHCEVLVLDRDGPVEEELEQYSW